MILPETDPLGVQAKKVRSEGDLEVQSNIMILLAKCMTHFVAKQVREKSIHTYIFDYCLYFRFGQGLFLATE